MCQVEPTGQPMGSVEPMGCVHAVWSPWAFENTGEDPQQCAYAVCNSVHMLYEVAFSIEDRVVMGEEVTCALFGRQRAH